MKQSLLIAMIAICVMGCTAPHYAIRTRNVGGVPFLGSRIVLVGNHEFSDLNALKKFVVTLPPGTVLVWDTGLVGYDLIPLAHSDMTLEAFGDFCRQHGVKFRLPSGWGQLMIKRAYQLRPSGFRQFVGIVSSPAITQANTRRAFGTCGMPYAESLQAWFVELRVPFGTGASVTFDRETNRLIVQNTRASQAMVSDIVAWCNAREFDQKVHCLEEHLNESRPVDAIKK